jgi:polyribonucleotide 5'-hydroxyl-kinase
MPVTNMLDVSSGFGSSATTGATELSPKIPLSYAYGTDSPTTNLKYYKHLLARLALAVNGRLSLIEKERQSGMLIDTVGMIDQTTGYGIIQAAVSEFEVVRDWHKT